MGVRDLAVPTLSTAATLLAVYAAGLIFIAQHIADRYTPLLYPTVVRRVGRVWLGLLSAIVLASLVLTLIRDAPWTNVADAFLLVGALALTVIGLYKTFQDTVDQARILGMIKHLEDGAQMTALRDLTWNSVNRGDVTATEFLLSFAHYGSKEQAELVDWITQYSQLLEQPWLRQAILANLTSGDFDHEAAESLCSAIKRLFICCLDREWYDSAHEIIVTMTRAMETTARFTEYHRYVAFDLGFNLHYIGDEGSATVRVSQRSPESLQDAQNLYLSRLTILRRSAIGDNDPSSVTQFCILLERLAESNIGIMHVSSQVWDILEDSYKRGLLEQDALESLASLIGYCRNSDEDYADFIDAESELDSRATHLALYIVALGYEDEVRRMMGNARLGLRKHMPHRLAMHNDISEDTYSTVAKILGCKSWPKT